MGVDKLPAVGCGVVVDGSGAQAGPGAAGGGLVNRARVAGAGLAVAVAVVGVPVVAVWWAGPPWSALARCWAAVLAAVGGGGAGGAVVPVLGLVVWVYWLAVLAAAGAELAALATGVAPVELRGFRVVQATVSAAVAAVVDAAGVRGVCPRGLDRRPAVPAVRLSVVELPVAGQDPGRPPGVGGPARQDAGDADADPGPTAKINGPGAVPFVPPRADLPEQTQPARHPGLRVPVADPAGVDLPSGSYLSMPLAARFAAVAAHSSPGAAVLARHVRRRLPAGGAGGQDAGGGRVDLGVGLAGQRAQVDLTRLGGLALSGPGGPGAARAVLAALVLAGHGGAPAHRVLVTSQLRGQLGLPTGLHSPALVEAAAGPAAANHLAAEAGYRAVLAETHRRATGRGAGLAALRTAYPHEPLPAVVLATTAAEAAASPRLAATAELGRQLGIGVLVAGDWPAAGLRCAVGAGGTLLAPAAGGPAALRRLFTLTPHELATLCDACGLTGEEITIPLPPHARHPAPLPLPATPAGRAPVAPAVPARPPGAGAPAGAGQASIPAPPPPARAVPAAPAAATPTGSRGPQGGTGQGSDLGRLPTGTAGSPHPGTAAPAACHPAPSPSGPAGQATPAAGVAATLAPATAGTEAAAPPVRLVLFGRPRLLAGGSEVDRGLRSLAREAAAYLATHREGASAARLAAALLPDTEPAKAAGQVHTAVSNLRRDLRRACGHPDRPIVASGPFGYRLDPADVSADVWEFTDALARARAARDDTHRAAALQAATDTYTGPLLDRAGPDWAGPLATTYEQQALDAYADLADLHAEADPGRAAALLDQAIGHAPYAEALYTHLMRIHAAAGRATAVYGTYRRLAARLAEVDTTPSPDTGALLARLTRRHHPAPAPPASPRPGRGG